MKDPVGKEVKGSQEGIVEVCSKRIRSALEHLPRNRTLLNCLSKGRGNTVPVKEVKNIKLDCVSSNVAFICDIFGKLRRDTVLQHCPREGMACCTDPFVSSAFGHFHHLALQLLTSP